MILSLDYPGTFVHSPTTPSPSTNHSPLCQSVFWKGKGRGWGGAQAPEFTTSQMFNDPWGCFLHVPGWRAGMKGEWLHPQNWLIKQTQTLEKHHKEKNFSLRDPASPHILFWLWAQGYLWTLTPVLILQSHATSFSHCLSPLSGRWQFPQFLFPESIRDTSSPEAVVTAQCLSQYSLPLLSW